MATTVNVYRASYVGATATTSPGVVTAVPAAAAASGLPPTVAGLVGGAPVVDIHRITYDAILFSSTPASVDAVPALATASAVPGVFSVTTPRVSIHRASYLGTPFSSVVVLVTATPALATADAPDGDLSTMVNVYSPPATSTATALVADPDARGRGAVLAVPALSGATAPRPTVNGSTPPTARPLPDEAHLTLVPALRGRFTVIPARRARLTPKENPWLTTS